MFIFFNKLSVRCHVNFSFYKSFISLLMIFSLEKYLSVVSFIFLCVNYFRLSYQLVSFYIVQKWADHFFVNYP